MVSRLMVGVTLRRLREQQGLTQADAGQAIGAPDAQIACLERGQAGFRMRDLVGLCALYGVTDQIQRATLLDLALRANDGEWWHAYRDVVPGWFARYLGLEQAASQIRGYEHHLVPGLLQVPDYARAILSRYSATTRETERRLELRMRRQDILCSPQSPRLWVVIGEEALRREDGSRATMRVQLRGLLRACDMPRVTIQILPQRPGVQPAGAGPVTMVRLPDPQLEDVVYLEQFTTADYPEDRGQRDYYRHAMNELMLQALPASSTQDILARMLRST